MKAITGDGDVEVAWFVRQERGQKAPYLALIKGESEQYGFEREFLQEKWVRVHPGPISKGLKVGGFMFIGLLKKGSIIEERSNGPDLHYFLVNSGLKDLTRDDVLKMLKERKSGA